MTKFLFISIKPEFANKIISNYKLIELRKSKPSSKAGDFVIIYSTVPDKSVIGFAKITRIIEATPDFMWNEHSDVLGIDKHRFFKYYRNSKKAIGIELSCICKLKTSISLNNIKSIYPRFSPPQTYKYIPFFSALRVYKIFV
jgi:predicted transcriptional regulator